MNFLNILHEKIVYLLLRNLEDIEAWIHYKYRDDCDFVLYKILLEKGKLIWLDTEWFEGVAELLMPDDIVSTHNKTLRNAFQIIGMECRTVKWIWVD